MAETIYYLIDTYNDIVENHADPRTKDWLMMYSLGPTLLLVAGFIILTKLKSSQMKNKKPLKLNKCTLGMNAIQCTLSAWLLYQATELVFDFSFTGKPSFEETDPIDLTILNVSWYFYIFRFLDFASAIILIQRKMDNRVTSLHIFYNSMAPVILWIGLKFIPYSHYTFGTYMNIIVYTLIYFQNILEALNPEYIQYMEWKGNVVILFAYFMAIITQAYYTLQSDFYASIPFGIVVAIQNLILFYIFYEDEISIMCEMYCVDNMMDLLRKCHKLGEMCIPNQEHLLTDTTETEKNQ